MKKERVIALVVILIIVLVVGVLVLKNNKKEGSSENNQVSTTDVKENNSETEYMLEYEGKKIKMEADFKEANLPKSNLTYEIESCPIEGIETSYTYDGLEILTNSTGDFEKIVGAYITGKDLSTKEGIRIGDSLNKMVKVYGNNYSKGDLYSYIYTKDNIELVFTLNTNNIITSINYNLIVK